MSGKRLRLAQETIRTLDDLATVLGGFGSGASGSAACPAWESQNRACPKQDNGKRK